MSSVIQKIGVSLVGYRCDYIMDYRSEKVNFSAQFLTREWIIVPISTAGLIGTFSGSPCRVTCGM